MAVVGYHSSLMEGAIFKDLNTRGGFRPPASLRTLLPLTDIRKLSSSDSLRHSLLPRWGATSKSFTPGILCWMNLHSVFSGLPPHMPYLSSQPLCTLGMHPSFRRWRSLFYTFHIGTISDTVQPLSTSRLNLFHNHQNGCDRQ